MKSHRLLQIALGLVVIGISTEPSPALRSPVPSQIFRMTLSNEPPTLDWNLATDSVSFTVLTNLMEGLTEYDRELRPRPAVAERWEVSPDGKTYRFYLRRDARWTDGRPVTAQDFEYSWKRLLDPATAAEYAYFLYDLVNAYEYNTGQIQDPSRVGVRAISPTLLEVSLKKPIVYFPSITTFMVTFPLRRDIVERHGNRWTEPEHIVTNGPFRLKEWRHEYKLTLAVNEDYFGGRPRLDEVRMFVVNESVTALTLYETGDLEIASLPPEAIPTYSSSSEYHKTSLLRGYYYGFNIEKKPFDDVRIRRAFSMAVDRNEIPRILKGGQSPAHSWVPPGMFGSNPAIGFWFDPKEARRLLAEAGYPDGKGLPSMTVGYNTGPVNVLIAENLQSQWKRHLGVAVGLENQEWKVYLKRLETDPPPIFRLGWGADYPDPDNFMVLFTSNSGNNHTRWRNSRYDALVARAAVERDPDQRQILYDEAQRILVKDAAAIIPLFFDVSNVLIKPYVKGLELNSMELLCLKKVELAAIPRT